MRALDLNGRTRNEWEELVETGAVRAGDERESTRATQSTKRLKRNEMVKKTRRSYIDVAVT